jgi:serine protease Do
MNTRFLLPAALAAVTAGSGLLAFSMNAGAQPNRQAPSPGQTRQFRFEFKNDGSGPRFWENGREVAPKEVQQRRGTPLPNGQMGDLLRRLMEEHEGGGEGNESGGLEDLFKYFNEQQQQGQPQPQGDNNDSPFNPQRMMEEMMRRMGGRGANPEGLGFGPESREELPRTSKHHLSALAEWRTLAAPARQSTVRVLKKKRQAALATIVSADGYALTKASEVEQDDFEVEFNDGRIVPAKVVDVMKAYDLALIKLEATGLVSAQFSSADHPVGTLIAAVGTSEDPTGVGVISVAARSLDERTKGFLGISMAPPNEEAPVKGVEISKVITGGAAKRAGLLEGDVIVSIDAEPINSPRQLQKLVAGLKPDQKVKIKLERNGKPKEIELSLGNRGEAASEVAKLDGGLDPRQLDQTALMGSNLSKNASGYPNALQTDLALQAQDAGGPVIDVDGAIVGLNIARSERVSTYLIPAKIVNAMLLDVQSGKFALSKDADTLNVELREINATIAKAQEAMKKAEEERDAATKALEKIQNK